MFTRSKVDYMVSEKYSPKNQEETYTNVALSDMEVLNLWCSMNCHLNRRSTGATWCSRLVMGNSSKHHLMTCP